MVDVKRMVSKLLPIGGPSQSERGSEGDRKKLFESNLKPKQHPHHNLTSILKGNEASWNVSARHKLRTNDDDADFRLFVRCSLINT